MTCKKSWQDIHDMEAMAVIKPSANLAGLLALPCRIAEFSCVPPHNEEEKTVDPDELSTTNTKLLNTIFDKWSYIYSYIYI